MLNVRTSFKVNKNIRNSRAKLSQLYPVSRHSNELNNSHLTAPSEMLYVEFLVFHFIEYLSEADTKECQKMKQLVV